MKSTYVDTRSANVGDIRCLFALASDSTNSNIKQFYVVTLTMIQNFYPFVYYLKPV